MCSMIVQICLSIFKSDVLPGKHSMCDKATCRTWLWYRTMIVWSLTQSYYPFPWKCNIGGEKPFSLAKILHTFIGFGTLLDLKEFYIMLYPCRDPTMGTNTQVKNKLIMFFPLNWDEIGSYTNSRFFFS